MKSKKNIKEWINALKDENSDVRGKAAQALGLIEDPRTVEPLIAALKDENSDVRGKAAQALGLIGDPRAVEPLIATLKDENSDVRGKAALALRLIGDITFDGGSIGDLTLDGGSNIGETKATGRVPIVQKTIYILRFNRKLRDWRNERSKRRQFQATAKKEIFDACSKIGETKATAKKEIIDFSKIVEDELKKLDLGQILFNPPQEMKVGVKERVEVRITKTITDDLSSGLRGHGVPQIEEIKVGTFMKVRLTGDNFDIEPLSHEEQLVAGEGFTQWDWDACVFG